MGNPTLEQRTIQKNKVAGLRLRANLASLGFVVALIILLIVFALSPLPLLPLKLDPFNTLLGVIGLLVGTTAGIWRFRVAKDIKDAKNKILDIETEILENVGIEDQALHEAEQTDNTHSKRVVLKDRRSDLQFKIIRSAFFMVVAIFTLIPLLFFAWLSPLTSAREVEVAYLICGFCCAVMLIPIFFVIVSLRNLIRDYRSLNDLDITLKSMEN